MSLASIAIYVDDLILSSDSTDLMDLIKHQ